jgi:hypothetical protein
MTPPTPAAPTAAVDATARAPAWLPIDTAPKTGDDLIEICVLGYLANEDHPGDRFKVVWWEPKIEGGCWWSDADVKCEPTHWMSLPTPPDQPVSNSYKFDSATTPTDQAVRDLYRHEPPTGPDYSMEQPGPASGHAVATAKVNAKDQDSVTTPTDLGEWEKLAENIIVGTPAHRTIDGRTYAHPADINTLAHAVKSLSEALSQSRTQVEKLGEEIDLLEADAEDAAKEISALKSNQITTGAIEVCGKCFSARETFYSDPTWEMCQATDCPLRATTKGDQKS